LAFGGFDPVVLLAFVDLLELLVDVEAEGPQHVLLELVQRESGFGS
jgi:hypothetical protein